MGLQLLGSLTPARFLSQYWQKKPLLVRQAIPAFAGIVPPSELFRLAASKNVESRLFVRRFETAAHRRGMQLDPRTLLLFDDGRMYVNGETIVVPVPQRVPLRALADRRTLAPGAKLPRTLCSLLYCWYLPGWLLIGERHG